MYSLYTFVVMVYPRNKDLSVIQKPEEISVYPNVLPYTDQCSIQSESVE